MTMMSSMMEIRNLDIKDKYKTQKNSYKQNEKIKKLEITAHEFDDSSSCHIEINDTHITGLANRRQVHAVQVTGTCT